MSVRFAKSILVILIVNSAALDCAVADRSLTSEQLVLLMKASRERYRSIGATMHATTYQQTDNGTKVTMTQDIESRWTKDKRFSKVVRTAYPDKIPHEGYTPVLIETYASTPKTFKKLTEVPDKRTPRGHIATIYFGEQNYEGFMSVYGAMWDLFNTPWEKMYLSAAGSAFDEPSSCHVLTIPTGDYTGAPVFILYVDPAKDYIATRREFVRTSDGIVVARIECSDFRETPEGLWVPHRYEATFPMVRVNAIYEVQEMKVNAPIPDVSLDFAFPRGTVVHDARYGVNSTVGEAGQALTPVVDPCSVGPAGPVTVPTAKDEDLLAAASKARDLQKAEAGAAPRLPAVEVSPAFVWVTATIQQYTLSVRGSDAKKPVLLRHESKDDGLVISSVQDHVQDDGQLLVNVARAPSQAGFANAVLSLQFAGEKTQVQITFVSAPLRDPP